MGGQGVLDGRMSMRAENREGGRRDLGGNIHSGHTFSRTTVLHSTCATYHGEHTTYEYTTHHDCVLRAGGRGGEELFKDRRQLRIPSRIHQLSFYKKGGYRVPFDDRGEVESGDLS